MSDKKDRDGLGGSGDSNKPINDDGGRGGSASRARNKTVMLSPEMTGQVRAMLQEDLAPPREAVKETNPPSPMDSLFSGPDRFETRSTRVLDSDSFGGYEPESFGESDRSFGAPDRHAGGFDPMTSLASSAPAKPMGREPSYEQESFIDERYEREQTPSPAVEQPAFGGFTVGYQEQEQTPAPRVTDSAPRRPVPTGPRSWHAVVSSKECRGRLVGLLVSYDNLEEGEIFEIRSGRFLITSRPTDNGDYLLVDDESISPLHAIVRVTEEGKVQVLDQLSEYGTGLCKVGAAEEEEVAGGLATVEHGDTVRFGKRYFVVVTIPAVVKRDA